MTSKSLKKLRDCFLDETVVFHLNDMKVPLISPSGEEMDINAMTEGYVVDIDENYFYLGDESGNIDRAVSHSVVGIVELAMIEDDTQDPIFNIPTEGEVH